MTYAELLAKRAQLEQAIGIQSASSGDRSVTYNLKNELGKVNRAIARYQQQSAGHTPGIRTASLNNG